MRIDTSNESTITFGAGNTFRPGDMIRTSRPDPNKWRRFWHWITFREPPEIVSTYVCTNVSNTSVQVKDSHGAH